LTKLPNSSGYVPINMFCLNAGKGYTRCNTCHELLLSQSVYGWELKSRRLVWSSSRFNVRVWSGIS